jgi:hypothetical protein
MIGFTHPPNRRDIILIAIIVGLLPEGKDIKFVLAPGKTVEAGS